MRILILVLTVLCCISCGTTPAAQTYSIPQDYAPVTNTGITYYIDSAAGNDTNNGLTQGSAWQTVAKVNAYTFAPGDRILFKRGGVWRERIIPQSGTQNGWLVYGAYGSGAKPLFIGSVELNATNDWVFVSNQIWKWNIALGEDAGNLIFDNESSCGVKKWTFAAMSAQGDFYYDKSGSSLYLISTTNPASVYSDIECALGQHMIYRDNPTYPHMGAHSISNVIFAGLAFKYGGAYGLKFQGVHHIYIAECDIEWMGGAEVDGQPQTRYGNGIEFFGIAYYCKAFGNKISQIYDSGVSYQAINSPAEGLGLSFYSNTIDRCGYAGYELWITSPDGKMNSIDFSGNILSNMGGGWGAAADQRKAGASWGFGYLLDSTPGQADNITICNNQIYGSNTAMFALSTYFADFPKIIIESNYYDSVSNNILFVKFLPSGGSVTILTQFQMTESTAYRNYTGKDALSVFVNH
jgi:hypothetical protein